MDTAIVQSIISEVMNYEVTTESGETVDCLFGTKSPSARIVNSPFVIGTTTTLLNKIAEKAISIFEETK